MRLGDGLSALVCIKRSIQLRNCSARRTANRTMSGGRADVAIAHPTMEWKRISPRFTRPHSCLPVASETRWWFQSLFFGVIHSQACYCSSSVKICGIKSSCSP
jgi:hypothetical protein